MSRIEIRPATDADQPRLAEIYNHYIEHTPVTFDVAPYSYERWLSTWWSQFGPDGRHRVVVADGGGEVLGYASSRRFRAKPAYNTTVETSLYCAPEATGRGIGPQLYEGLFDALAGEDIHQYVALITLPNDPSEKLHQRFGFERVGLVREVGRKFEQFWDVAEYQRAAKAK